VSRQRKPSRQVSVDEQIQVVLAVLKGELSLAEAARRHGVSSATATPSPSKSTCSATPTTLCDPTRPSTNAHHVRLTSPSNTAISVWPLADPLLDWEILT
jgi:hypothetical protein